MKRTKFAVALAIVSFSPLSAMAQARDFHDHGLARNEGRISLGFTLPFGVTRAETAPRLELRMARDTVGWDGQRRSNFDGRLAETRLGLSLDGQRRWLVNGRQIGADERRGISTLGGIAIGVGVALVAGGLLLADAARDASE